jgi:uncharacterized membrane protein YfcA
MLMLLILSICALLTSTISGIIGMGGGVLLLSIMTFFVPYKLLIPIHGIVQLVSNSSRSYYLRKNIRYDFVIPFLFGAPFGFFIAYLILKQLTDTNYLYLLLGLFVLYTVFKPKKFPEFRLHGYHWGILGFFAGIQGSIIGVTGPLIGPFYLRSDLKKEEIVATKAIQQIVTHLFKIPLFLSLDFNYFAHMSLISFMSVCTIAGSFIGVKLLGRCNDSLFKILFKIVLFIAGIRLLYKFWISL